MRRYQKRLAEGIGWKEKDLTIGHAVICTIIPALSQVAFAYFLKTSLVKLQLMHLWDIKDSILLKEFSV